MCKRMQGIVFIYAEVCTGNKDGSGCSKGNITSSVSHGSCSYCSRCIIACSCDDLYIFRKSEFCCHFRLQTSYDFVAFIKLRKLFFCHTADIHHFFGPAFVFYIHQKHSGCIRIIGAEASGQAVSQIILRKHDLCDLCKILRLIFLYPQDLWCGKSGKCNVCCVFRKRFFSDLVIQIIGLFCSTSIIPEDCRADDLVFVIQNDQSVHLSTKADSCNLALVTLRSQFFDAFYGLGKPVFRMLF